jgi:hypothetical protein
MMCAVEMVLCGMIYIPSFMKIGTGVQTLIGGIHTDTPSNIIVSDHRVKL